MLSDAYSAYISHLAEPGALCVVQDLPMAVWFVLEGVSPALTLNPQGLEIPCDFTEFDSQNVSTNLGLISNFINPCGQY